MITWQKQELQIMVMLAPSLQSRNITYILNSLYNTDRTSKSIMDKKRRVGLKFLKHNPQKAIDAVDNSKLPNDMKEKIKRYIKKLSTSSEKTDTKKKQYSLNTDQNYSVLEQGSDIKPNSLEEMIKIFHIDETVWAVERYTINRWDQAQKTPMGAKVTPLYQIKVWLVRKNPVVYKWPVVQPITCKPTISKLKKSTSSKKKLRKAIIIPDAQMSYRRDQRTGYLNPLHDRKAWDVICQIAEKEKPDEIILLGDMLDLPDWTDKFIISPDLFFTTQPSLMEFHWWLRRMKAITPKLVYLEGNHEARLQRIITRNLIAACGLKPANHPNGPSVMSIQNLLGLEELGVEYVGPYPNGQYWLNDNLRAIHGNAVRQGSGATVAAQIKDLQTSVIFGHIHRLEQASKLVWDSKDNHYVQAFSPGSLCRLDDGIVPSNKARQNWQNGFAVVDYESGDGSFNVNLVSIANGTCIYKGQVWAGHEPVKEIAKDIDWEALIK